MKTVDNIPDGRDLICAAKYENLANDTRPNPGVPLDLLPIMPKRADIRSSSMGTLQKCSRRYMWEERYGLRRAGNYYSEALSVGTLSHILLNSLYMGESLHTGVQKAVGYIADKERAILDQLSGGTKTLPGMPLDKITKGMQADLSKSHAMVNGWNKFIGPRELADWDVLAVEPYIRAKIPGISAYIAGELDIVMRHRRTQELRIFDHKTTAKSAVQRAISCAWEPASTIIYPILLREVCAGGSNVEVTVSKYGFGDLEEIRLSDPSNVTSTVHNILRKPTISFCNKDKTFDDYLDRVADRYEQDMKDPLSAPFVQSITKYHGHPLELEENAVKLREIDRAAVAKVDIHRFPRTMSSDTCTAYGLCPLAELCMTQNVAATQWPAIITGKFEQEYRSPDNILT